MKVEMISWIAVAMGVFLCVVGIIIWAKKKIDLVHGDDAYKVAEYDVEPYARVLGIVYNCVEESGGKGYYKKYYKGKYRKYGRGYYRSYYRRASADKTSAKENQQGNQE